MLMRFDDVMLIEMMCSVLVTSVITVDWFDSMLLQYSPSSDNDGCRVISRSSCRVSCWCAGMWAWAWSSSDERGERRTMDGLG